MGTKQRSDIQEQIARLRRLGVVFADELRLTAVTELYMQEMSPPQFHARFGGSSVAAVNRHFRTLMAYHWLRLVRSAPGPHGRGRQHFYRSTELAVFDQDVWGLLPYPVRITVSSTIFKQFSERVREALEAGTFDKRSDRHFSWSPLLLDQVGWERVVAAVDALFASLAEEQEDAKLRIFHSGEEAFLATVGMAAFESPRGPSQSSAPLINEKLEVPRGSTGPLTYRLSKVFDDPICLKIVTEAALQEMSAPKFTVEFGGDSVKGIRRRFKMLASLGWLVFVGTKTGGHRRGGVEHFYRATGPAVFDNVSWAQVPSSARATYSWTIFQQLSEQVEAAAKAGTLDARDDRHLTWSLLRLDELGWGKIRKALDAFLAFLTEEKKQAERRMASSDEAARFTVALALFESPKKIKLD